MSDRPRIGRPPNPPYTPSEHTSRRGRRPTHDLFVWEKHLTEKGARTIKHYALQFPDLSYPEIARHFDISVHIVENLMGGKTWKHIK